MDMGVLLATLAVLLLSAAPAGADTFQVTRTDDPPTGACDPGDCSLREAVAAANATAATDTVALPAGTFTLTQDQVEVTQSTRIVGAGRAATIVTGADTGGGGAALRAGAFLVTASTTFSHLAVSGNRVTTDDPGDSITVAAGGIVGNNSVTLSLLDVDVSANRTDANNTIGAGGVIVNVGSTLNLVNSSVSDNVKTGNATIAAGGVFANSGSAVNATSSTVAGNRVEPGTVNTATGGIHASFSDATLTNVTVSGNSVTPSTGTRVGGFSSRGDGADATLTHVTLAGNTAAAGAGTAIGNLSQSGTGSRGLRSSIVAGGSPNNCDSVWTVFGGNVESANTCGMGPGDLADADPQLAPLADNGGPTATHALAGTSPAVDFAETATCPGTDQRGVARPQMALCDSGAYEFGPPVNVSAPALSGGAIVGATLTCAPGTWRGEPSFAFEWLRDGTAIAGATGSTYLATPADASRALQCRVSASNPAGTSVATSGPLGIAPAAGPPPAAAPVNQRRPAIFGAARRGVLVRCGAGAWSGSPAFGFRWLRNGVAIPRATASRYRLSARDVGRAVQCEVRASDAGGAAVAESAPRVVANACIVPRLRGARLADARRRLVRAGCRPGRLRLAFSSSVRPGRVISSSPGARANRRAGTRVSLRVSKGRRRR